MQHRFRSFAATLAVALGVGSVFTPAAFAAGQYDYQLTGVPFDTFFSRGVNHDYSYLRGSISFSGTVCVARGGGASFCGTQGAAAHSYGDTCNSCLSYYKHKEANSPPITVHDEWR